VVNSYTYDAVQMQASSLHASFTTEQTNTDLDEQYAFRVNTTTGNPQVEPSVGMDAHGNFVIAWCTAASN